ncbi:MAG: type II toxin-antitoxin system VapC family toxin [Candidatus Marithrix sp.]|nr:type II toxin-antitoxin system VapC family toxin [Candidatus Marithrix sp.]
MINKVFLDTSFAIALISKTDNYHKVALKMSNKLSNFKLVTSRAVMLEIGNALSKQQYRVQGIQFLQSLEYDPQVDIVTITDSLYTEAFELFCSYHDKLWGLVDCLSFVIMKQQNIMLALTTDRHFQQAGFRALLLESEFKN